MMIQLQICICTEGVLGHIFILKVPRDIKSKEKRRLGDWEMCPRAKDFSVVPCAEGTALVLNSATGEISNASSS